MHAHKRISCVPRSEPKSSYPFPTLCVFPPQRSAEKFKNIPGAGHVYVKIRGGELGDRNAKKGDYSSEALIKVRRRVVALPSALIDELAFHRGREQGGEEGSGGVGLRCAVERRGRGEEERRPASRPSMPRRDCFDVVAATAPRACFVLATLTLTDPSLDQFAR